MQENNLDLTGTETLVARVNPKLIGALDKSMWFLFYETDQVSKVEEELQQARQLDAFVTQGTFDFTILCLERDRAGISVRLGSALSYLDSEMAFRVEEFIKHDGCNVMAIQSPRVTGSNDNRISELVRVRQNWNDVLETRRRELMDARFLIAREPLTSIGDQQLKARGQRRSFILVRIANPYPPMHTVFVNLARNILMDDDQVVNFYKGSSMLGYSYIIEMIADSWHRDELVLQLLRECRQNLIRVKTVTIDVVRTVRQDAWSSLTIPAASEEELELLKELAIFNTTDIPPRVTDIAAFLKGTRDIVLGFDKQSTRDFISERVVVLARAMASGDLGSYQAPFCDLVEWVKEKFVETAHKHFGNDESNLREMQTILGLRTWNTGTWTFGDALDFYRKLAEREGTPLDENDRIVLGTVADLRNALVHRRYKEIPSPQSLEDAFLKLIDFVVRITNTFPED